MNNLANSEPRDEARTLMNAPSRLESDEKRDRNVVGRFMPGHNLPGPGRPKGSGIDIRRVAEEKSAEQGVDLETALWEVVQAMLEQAKKGDVASAKVLLDRLCVNDSLKVQLDSKVSLEMLVLGSLASPEDLLA